MRITLLILTILLSLILNNCTTPHYTESDFYEMPRYVVGDSCYVCLPENGHRFNLAGYCYNLELVTAIEVTESWLHVYTAMSSKYPTFHVRMRIEDFNSFMDECLLQSNGVS